MCDRLFRCNSGATRLAHVPADRKSNSTLSLSILALAMALEIAFALLAVFVLLPSGILKVFAAPTGGLITRGCKLARSKRERRVPLRHALSHYSDSEEGTMNTSSVTSQNLADAQL